MEFKWHILIGFSVSYILVYFFNFAILIGLIIFLSSFLIDVDHYLWYALSMKDWNFKNGIKWYIKAIPRWHSLSLKERDKFKRGIFIFHGIEFWLILFALSYWKTIFMWILIGVFVHMIADWIDIFLWKEPFYVKIFPLYTLIKNKNKKHIKELCL